MYFFIIIYCLFNQWFKNPEKKASFYSVSNKDMRTFHKTVINRLKYYLEKDFNFKVIKMTQKYLLNYEKDIGNVANKKDKADHNYKGVSLIDMILEEIKLLKWFNSKKNEVGKIKNNKTRGDIITREQLHTINTIICEGTIHFLMCQYYNIDYYGDDFADDKLKFDINKLDDYYKEFYEIKKILDLKFAYASTVILSFI